MPLAVDSNWFAVGINFIIVVAGVLFALMTEQWWRDAQLRADLEIVEIAINRDLLTNLFATKEILALPPPAHESPVRAAETRWRVRDGEQRTRKLQAVGNTRRQSLDSLFTSANLIRATLETTSNAQSRLKILALAKNITPADRTRYLENLHYHDERSGMLELAAQQALEQIQSIGFRPDQTYIDEFRVYMTDYNTTRQALYGKCFVPFDMPFLNPAGTKVTAPSQFDEAPRIDAVQGP